MKKITAVLVALAMVLSLVPAALAAEDGAKAALESVKTRIDVPESLTEFDYSESSYDGVKNYWFNWNDEDYNNSVSISADEKGRIISYYTYIRRSADSKKIIRTTTDEAEKVAYKFLEKAFPEMLENENDRLVLNKERTNTYSNGDSKSFRFLYERMREGRLVWGNSVSIFVIAYDDMIYVTDLYADIDYDAKFEENTEPKALEESFMEEYPAKMVYIKHYGEKEDSVKLVYQIESGFIGNLNGKKLEAEDEAAYARNTMASAQDSMADAGGMSAKQVQLTPKELEELENMGELIDVKELEKKLRDMKELAITDEMQISNSYTQKIENGYIISLSLSDNESRYLDASFNAETGEIRYVYNYDYSVGSKNDLSDAEKLEAQRIGEEFIKKVSGDKISETEFEDNVDNGVRAVRVVNGVRYPANAIRAYYNTACGFINSYSITWDEDVTKFPKPDGAMSADEAYKKAFEKQPLRDAYILSDGVYKCGAALESSMTLDAFTGENIYENENEKPSYDDISGHWAEEIIKTLLDMDIYLDGTSFRPNDEITQGDMLRLFGSVFYYTSFARNKTIDYSWLEISKGVIKKDEIDENASVTREEAFKVFVKMMGFGEVAELDIFADIFEDSSDFEGPLGSAAILKGMGIIASDGYAHPDRLLTHAEAAAIIYNYLDRGAN